jgi:hypothetical protein
MTSITTKPNVETVRELSATYSNWGRWGKDDQRGTLNHCTEQEVARAASSIRSGKRISLALPVDANGPQIGGFGRFNPIHLMFRDGGDIVSGTTTDTLRTGSPARVPTSTTSPRLATASPAAGCCSISPGIRASTRSNPATPSPQTTSKAASRPTV